MEDIFWKSEKGLNEFVQFGHLHIGIIIAVIASVIMIVKYQEQIRNLPQRLIELSLAFAILIPRSLLYLWYIDHESNFREILPLYICRVTIICCLYYLFTRKNHLNFIIYFMGLFGSVLAMLFVDTGGYSFPHVTFFSFFLGHIGMLLTVVYMIVIKGYRPDDTDYKHIIYFIIGYMSIASCVNILFDGNYNYLERAPFMLKVPRYIQGGLLYKGCITGIFIFVSTLEYLPYKLKGIKEIDGISSNNPSLLR